MGPRSENRGYAHNACTPTHPAQASMGPRSENRGYGAGAWATNSRCRSFNGSTVREPWLCEQFVVHETEGATLQWVHGPRTVVMTLAVPVLNRPVAASMGPRSENRGYAAMLHAIGIRGRRLQWVHGPRTVVMPTAATKGHGRPQLQWVHGPRTVVMLAYSDEALREGKASMGPRSENRGYGDVKTDDCGRPKLLQWVHGPRTVVMPRSWKP